MATEVIEVDPGPDRTIDPGIGSPSDASLVRQLLEGSEDALAGLYDRHAHAVYAAAMRASRDRSIAAEVVQDTFLTLWNRAELFDASRGALPAWLVTIARNRALDRLRAAARHERAAAFSSFGRAEEDDHSIADWLTVSGELIAAADPEPGPEIALFSKETRAAVEDALASLAPMERCVIVLAYDGGLSQAEIAARLGWPIGTVKTRTRRALRQLRDRFERAQAGEPARDPVAEWVSTEPAILSQTAVPAAGQGDRRAWWSAVSPLSPAPVASSCQGCS
jgi:RNA polymerase sigma-70 factor (ECF subfamily)